ncbi:NAD(P)/FAD-dependent oxidoreductase [Streptosporangium pseudovulgare]|uniref:Pyridine nucleotide-disulfide oxidoreductase n=1 Tax=Streptosporangium pseudovulgare TaxID=35765 RepID=A0ABQ2QGA3_9ACTN|nr:FAD-dependent oxidoreductase [Streptosporangium pseudovulgare]GGP80675.1 pyridine nucleotide-disulfide oxidoreductase [Streptosporangium pseudovulgare]
MSRIVIVGGGFAGVWSAVAAARTRGDGKSPRITLVTPDDDLVLRPRLHRLDPDAARVPLKRILAPVGVEHLRAKVTGIDISGHRVTADGHEIGYDRLVLASGSRLVRPGLPGAEHLFDVDTAEGTARLASRLRGLDDFTAVVVGAGFTGLEVATELAARGNVVLVERADVVGPDLGPGPRPVIEAALADLGIRTLLGTTVAAVDAGGVTLAEGTRIAADAVVWTGGVQAGPLTALVPGERDHLGRLAVDRHLRVRGEATGDVFAAGDVAAALAEPGHHVLQCCQHAVPMGKVAGRNAAADLLGLPPEDFAPDPYVTCLDLGAAGAVTTAGWDRTVRLTGAAAKERKELILRMIRPPLDDAGEIFRAASRQGVGVPR